MTLDPLADPAFRLLVAAVDWSGATGRTDRVRAAADRLDGNWSGFLELVARHRLAPLALHGLGAAGIDPPPALVRRAQSDKRRALSLMVEGRALLETLEQSGIAAMMLKGALLSQQVFGDPGMRQSADLDLLVDESDLQEARNLIGRRGYRLQGVEPPWNDPRMTLWRRSAKDLTLINGDKRITLELHCRLKAVPALLPGLSLSDARNELVFAGWTYRTLDDADQFVYLCVHGATSMWHRLKWLVDIEALLAHRDEAEIASLMERGRQLGVDRCVALAMLLCRHFWGQPLPAALIERRRRDRKLAMQCDLALKTIAEPFPPRGLIGTTQLTVAAFRLRDDWAFRRSALAAALIDADLIARWKLPQVLWPLYIPGRLGAWIGHRLG